MFEFVLHAQQVIQVVYASIGIHGRAVKIFHFVVTRRSIGTHYGVQQEVLFVVVIVMNSMMCTIRGFLDLLLVQ